MIEQTRYQSYTLEKSLYRLDPRSLLARSRVYVLLTRAQCTAAMDWTIAQIAAGGAGIVQLREKDLPDRELLALAQDVRKWTRKANLLMIVNDRVDIARLVDADGVHLGQDDLSVAEARQILGPDRLVGVSTHTVEQVQAAVQAGADYIGIGPVFPSRTKAFDHFPGLEFVKAATSRTSLPAFALGGITLENVADVTAAGARRVALSQAVIQADDPQAVVMSFQAHLEQYPLEPSEA
jgi:thiamine-phosphate pyrophosphorylase